MSSTSDFYSGFFADEFDEFIPKQRRQHEQRPQHHRGSQTMKVATITTEATTFKFMMSAKKLNKLLDANVGMEGLIHVFVTENENGKQNLRYISLVWVAMHRTLIRDTNRDE